MACGPPSDESTTPNTWRWIDESGRKKESASALQLLMSLGLHAITFANSADLKRLVAEQQHTAQ